VVELLLLLVQQLLLLLVELLVRKGIGTGLLEGVQI